MIRTGEDRQGLLFADGGEARARLGEERFAQFSELCALMSEKLAGPLPEPGPESEPGPDPAESGAPIPNAPAS
jgi:hypothetical protein